MVHRVQRLIGQSLGAPDRQSHFVLAEGASVGADVSLGPIWQHLGSKHFHLFSAAALRQLRSARL